MKHPAIHIHESFNTNIESLVLHYNQLAVQYLQKQSNVHENIHQTRLCFKRMRSFLRLGRSGLGEVIYRDFNTFYRDQARALSQLRDVTALIETLPFFVKTRRSQDARSFLLQFKRNLEEKRREHLQAIISGNINAEVISKLESKNDEIIQWQFNGDVAEIFSAGAQRIYNRGRRLFKVTLSDPNAHNMHEWRKQVKYFWYQLVVLTPLWPGMFTAWAKEVQTLSQWLGKHHDLVLLEEKLAEVSANQKNRVVINNLRRNIAARKSYLEKTSLQLAQKIYAEAPAATGKRLLNYFDATKSAKC